MRQLFPKHVALAYVLCAFTSLPAISGDLDDGTILAIYNQVNSFDIETGLLGAERGHAEAVRSLGKRVAGDHSGVRLAADQLAREIGVTLLLPASRNDAATKHYESMSKLQSLSGEAFDKAYLTHETAFHTAAIEALKTALLPAAKNPKLIEHFNTVLPAFQSHLEYTKTTAKELFFANTSHPDANNSLNLTDDNAVFAVYDQLNTFDITMASLALEHATSQGALGVARMIVDDHVPIRAKARKLALQIDAGNGLPNNDLALELHEVMRRVRSAIDHDFNNVYLKEESVFSERFVFLVEHELIPSTTNTALKQHLKDVLARFDVHLQHIRHAKSMKSGVGHSSH